MRHTGLFRTGFTALALVAALLAGNLHAQISSAAPTKIIAHYKIHKSGILIGTVEEQFTRSGQAYKISSETRTAGALRWVLNDQVILSSEGSVGANGLEPARYELKRQNDPTKNIAAFFDYGKNQLVSTRNNRTETYALPRGTLDRIAALYQFTLFATLPPAVTFWMSQGKEAEQYHYRKQSEPVITVGGIAYPTVHYARETKKGESQAQLWLAKNRYFIPVKLIFEDSHGLSLEQTLVALQTQ